MDLNTIPYDGNEHAFSDEQRDSITFVGNRMYKHAVIRINYTTYDLRRAQDSINVRTHPYLMTLGHEDGEEGMKLHPYWYAKVLGIFHVNVRCSGSMESERMEFLWVHWFGRDPDHEGGFETRRLHRIGLTDSEDPTSYEFLNPNDVLRSVHLIPAFSPNEETQEMDDSDDDAIPQSHYYVSMYAIFESFIYRHLHILRFVDRDMFMRFLGGGIGHKATDHLQQRTPTCVHDETSDPHDDDEDIIPHNAQDHTQVEGDDVLDGDLEEVETDEEADYGYADILESEGESSEGEGEGEGEGEDEEETDANEDDDEVS